MRILNHAEANSLRFPVRYCVDRLSTAGLFTGSACANSQRETGAGIRDEHSPRNEFRPSATPSTQPAIPNWIGRHHGAVLPVYAGVRSGSNGAARWIRSIEGDP